MADLMEDAATFLVDELATNLSQTVTLKRGGKSTAGVKATKCPPRADSDPEFQIDTNTSDFVIATTQYVINSVAVEPEENDLIIMTSGEQWVILPLANEPHFRPLDPYRKAYRIHAKRHKAA